MKKTKYRSIKIAIKNSKQVVWEKGEWDDYLYDGKFFNCQEKQRLGGVL